LERFPAPQNLLFFRPVGTHPTSPAPARLVHAVSIFQLGDLFADKALDLTFLFFFSAVFPSFWTRFPNHRTVMCGFLAVGLPFLSLSFNSPSFSFTVNVAEI